MLKLKTMRSLNCSAGGVEYHYVSTFEELVDTIEHGLYISKPEGQQDEKFNVPFVSLSRTRINPIVVGPSRWKYGVVLSKDRLSNLGKIKPYSHGGSVIDGHDVMLTFRYNHGLSEIYKNRRDTRSLLLSFEFVYHPEDGDDSVLVEGTMFNTLNEEHGNSCDLELSMQDAKVLVDWIKEVGYTLYPAIDTYISGSIYTFGLSGTWEEIQNLLTKVPPQVVRLVRDLEKGVSPENTEFAGTLTVIATRKLHSEPDRTVEHKIQISEEESKQLLEFISNLDKKKDSDSLIEIESTEPDYTINLILGANDIGDYSKLPDIIKKIRQIEMLPEHEDRLLLPHAKPHENYAKTIPAIVGVMIPDTEWRTKAVRDLRAAHPELKYYAYTVPGSKMRKTGKASRKNPVA